MILLLIFSFIAGVVTILSPCIFPILPLILSSGIDNKSKYKPYGIVLGFILSFTFFTLFLAQLVKLTPIGAEGIRNIAVFILLVFGASYFFKKVTLYFEQLFSKFTAFSPKQVSNNFIGGVFLGLSLGLVWTPCVGPILASVISLSLIGQVTFETFLITFFYSLGTAIPMLIIILTGRKIFLKLPFLQTGGQNIQKIFGLLMIFTALLIYFKVDKNFQVYFNSLFPYYAQSLTYIETLVDFDLPK